MIIHSVTIENFRSFKGRQTFLMPETPGLYFMQGINEAEPRLEGNGTGKSTIWEAITWCFFAKTSRGLKAGDVCNWDAEKGTSVRIHFTSPSGEECCVARTWKPISWTLDWLADEAYDQSEDLTKSQDNPLLGWLALEYQPFLTSIMMAQGQPMFLDLKHDRKAELFSEVMGLDRWLEYSTKASKKASAEDQVIRSLERRQAELQGQMDGQKDYSGSIEEFEAQREQRILDIEPRYKAKIDEHAELEKKLPDLIKAENVAMVAWREVNSQVISKNEEVEKQRKVTREVTRELDRLEDQETALKQRLKKLDDSGICPTCGQPVKQDTHRGDLLKELKDLDLAIRKAQKEVDQEDITFTGLIKELNHLDSRLAELRDDQEQEDRAVKNCRRDLAILNKELDELETRAEEIMEEVNPFKKLQEEARNLARRRQSEMGEVALRLDAANEAYSLYSYWVRGFKDLRLQLIAEALTELEVEVNSCVAALGLLSWELHFEIDRETRGGSIQRGFNVQVISPHNPKPVPWEAWSGGEAQRLRLAANMGLANLIRSRSGSTLNLEVWDEPSTALSPQGVKDLFESLERRAQVEQRVIWVVDHTAYSYGGFAGGATVTKKADGSVIEQY